MPPPRGRRRRRLVPLAAIPQGHLEQLQVARAGQRGRRPPVPVVAVPLGPRVADEVEPPEAREGGAQVHAVPRQAARDAVAQLRQGRVAGDVAREGRAGAPRRPPPLADGREEEELGVRDELGQGPQGGGVGHRRVLPFVLCFCFFWWDAGNRVLAVGRDGDDRSWRLPQALAGRTLL